MRVTRYRSELEFVLLATAIAVVMAREVSTGKLLYATVLGALPLVMWLFARPVALLVLLGAAIPWSVQSLAGGSTGGYNVSATDLLLVALIAVILFERTTGSSLPIVSTLRPVALPLLQYGGLMALLVFFHPLDLGHIVKTGQRFELFLFPLAVGAYAALENKHFDVLKAYVVSATLLAAVWPFDHNLAQKNPVGQFIANAILLFVAIPGLRRLLPCLVILIPGLLITESRGAILAAGMGVFVILLMRGFGLRVILSRAIPVAVAALVAFLFIPASYRARVTTLSAGSANTQAQYSIYLRQEFAVNAKQIIRAHPWTGVGVGDYYRADSQLTTAPVLDPHQVLYLQAAEGGYGLAASFIFLIAGLAFAMRAFKKVDVAAAAAGVLLATATHGLVDVYWARGTPVLSFLLVGMVCGSLVRERSARAASL